MKVLKSPKIIVLLVLAVALIGLSIWGVVSKNQEANSQPSQEEKYKLLEEKAAEAEKDLEIADAAMVNVRAYRDQILKNKEVLEAASLDDLVEAMTPPAAEVTPEEKDASEEGSGDSGEEAAGSDENTAEREMSPEKLAELEKQLDELEAAISTGDATKVQTSLITLYSQTVDNEPVLVEPFLTMTGSVISHTDSFAQAADNLLREIRKEKKRIQNLDRDPSEVAEEARDTLLANIEKMDDKKIVVTDMETQMKIAEDAYADIQTRLGKIRELATVGEGQDVDVDKNLNTIQLQMNKINAALKKLTKVGMFEASAVRSAETLLRKMSRDSELMIHDDFPGLDLGEQFSASLDAKKSTAVATKEKTFQDFLAQYWDRLLWLAGIILLIAALAFLKSAKPETHRNIVNGSKKNMMLVALVMIIIIFFVLTNYSLLTPTNVSNIINQNAYIIILACGMLMCIICSANIDLSVGRVMGFIGACAAKFMIEGNMPVYLAVPLCLLIGIAIGAWQGFWIAYMRIPAFVVTLAGQLTFYGLTMMILQGLTINNFPKSFSTMFSSYVPDYFGMAGFNLTTMLIGVAVVIAFILIQITGRASRIRKGYPVETVTAMWVKTGIISVVLLWLFYSMAAAQGLPTVLFTVAIVLLLYLFITSRTVIGRHLYAMGGNVNAARLSGVKTQKMLFLAYVNMGLLAALAGLAYAARLNAASPQAGQGDELYAIASCYIGGASAYGGIGTVGGALIGAMSMGVIKNGMSIMSLGQDIQQIVLGLVLLSAVVIDIVSKSSGASSLPFIGKLHARKEKKAEAQAAKS